MSEDEDGEADVEDDEPDEPLASTTERDADESDPEQSTSTGDQGADDPLADLFDQVEDLADDLDGTGTVPDTDHATESPVGDDPNIRADLEAEFDDLDLPDENGDDPFADLLDEFVDDADAPVSEDEDIGAEFDAIESAAEAGTEASGSSTGFDDLLEQVEVRERAAKRSERGRSDEHDLGSIHRTKYADSTLIVGPLGADADNETCLSAFDQHDLADQRVLLVTLARRGPSRLDVFLDRYGMEEPAALAHVGRTSAGDHAPDEAIRTVDISDPEDLTHLGISISMIVADWMDGTERIAICLHSLTVLLEYVDDQRVFRFLHLLLGRLADAGATVHVHADVDADDRQVFGLFGELFDVMVEVTEDGLEVIG